MIKLFHLMLSENTDGKSDIERDEENRKRHQKEIETLIRNLSMSINLKGRGKTTTEFMDSLSMDSKGLSGIIPLEPVKKHINNGKPNFKDETKDDHNVTVLQDEIDAKWQTVEGIKGHKFFVYSAFYDTRDTKKPVVRVIGVTRTKRSDKVMCRLYYDTKKEFVDSSQVDKRINQTFSTKSKINPPSFHDVAASISIIRENWNLKYSACFVICPLFTEQASYKSVGTVVPDSVSVIPVVSNNYIDINVTNRLPVINSKNGGTGTNEVNKTDIGVCVKPIHFHYNKTFELIEFIELNKILGVSKFTFYNHTMSDEVGCVLDYYMNQENEVSVMSWDLKVDSQTEIRTEGLFAALNDCLYRNMNEFHYLMLIDFDEFVIPHLNDTLPDMLEYLNSNKVTMKNGRKLAHPKVTSSYSFQNSFFYLQFGKISTFLKTKLMKNIMIL